MKLEEVKTIVNRIEPEDAKNVSIKVNYNGGISYYVLDIDSFCFMNGNLVFNIELPGKVYMD